MNLVDRGYSLIIEANRLGLFSALCMPEDYDRDDADVFGFVDPTNHRYRYVYAN